MWICCLSGREDQMVNADFMSRFADASQLYLRDMEFRQTCKHLESPRLMCLLDPMKGSTSLKATFR